MAYTFKDVELPDRRVLLFALRRIHGIGFARASYICSVIGLSLTNRVGFLNSYAFFVLTFLMKQYYGTDLFLKRIRENALKFFLTFKSYKAIRFSAGLPIRGQHTHNNARTSKNFKFNRRKF